MKYAILADLEVLQRHISQNLHWNGKEESQVMFEDEDTPPVALLTKVNTILDCNLRKTAVWFEGVKLAEVTNPENALYITALENLEQDMIPLFQEHDHLAIVDINGELDLHQLVKSSHLELVDTVIEDCV